MLFDFFHWIFYMLAASWVLMFWILVGTFILINRLKKIIEIYEDMFKEKKS